MHVGVRRQQDADELDVAHARGADERRVRVVAMAHVHVGAQPDQRGGHRRLPYVQEHGIAVGVARIGVGALADDALERRDVVVLKRGPEGARLTILGLPRVACLAQVERRPEHGVAHREERQPEHGL